MGPLQRRRDRIEQQRALGQGPTYGQDPRQQPDSPLGNQMSGITGQGTQGFGAARQAQQGTLGMYQGLASGQGPSLAQAQLAASTGQNIANQASMAAQSRGGNLAGQARQVAGMGAAAQMGAQQQAAQIRAGEQLAAMQGMAGMANTMADQSLQQQLGGAGLQLGAQGQANQWGLGQRGLDLQQLGLLQQQQQNNREFGMGLGQMGMQGAAGGLQAGMMFSDERVKNMQENPMTATQTVGALTPFSGEYKPGYGAPGERAMISAQQLEQTPAGASLVHDTPYGKTVDVGGLASLATAATAEQEQRIKRLESLLGNDATHIGADPGQMNRSPIKTWQGVA